MNRRPYALALFVALWAVILVVPKTRVMLLRQGDEVIPTLLDTGKPTPVLGRSIATDANRFYDDPDNLTELAERYPDDVRVQAKVLDWRRAAQVTDLYREKENGGTQNPAPVTAVKLNSPGLNTGETSYERILAEYLSSYDALIKKNPGNVWLLANRLRTNSLKGLARNAGVLDLTGDKSVDKNRVFADVQARKRHYDPSADVAAAKKGQQLEPQNIYFDLCLVAIYYQAFRDEEARRTLQLASYKTQYDDHVIDDWQASVYVRSLVRPVLEEDRFGAFAAEVLPQFAVHRNVGRLATWQAIQMERVGKHKQAIDLYAAVARVGTVMVKNQNFICSQVGTAICFIAWAGEKRRWQRPMGTFGPVDQDGIEKERVQRLNFATDKFASYAEANGRQYLAIETRREAESLLESMPQNAQIQTSWGSDNYSEYLSGGTLDSIAQLWWLNVTALCAVLISLLSFGLFSILWTWKAGSGDSVITGISANDRASRLILVACVIAGLSAAALGQGAGVNTWHLPESFEGSDYGSAIIFVRALRTIVIWSVIPSVLLCVLAVLWRFRREWRDARQKTSDAENSNGKSVRGGRPATDRRALALLGAKTLFHGCMSAVFLMAGIDSSTEGKGLIFAVLLAIVLIGWLVLRYEDKQPRAVGEAAGFLCRSCAFWYCLFAVFAVLRGDTVFPHEPGEILELSLESATELSRLYAPYICSALMLLALYRWGRRLPTRKSPELHATVTKTMIFWSRDMAASLVILWSVVYVVVAFSSLPYRHTMSEALQFVSENGDRALAHSRFLQPESRVPGTEAG